MLKQMRHTIKNNQAPRFTTRLRSKYIAKFRAQSSLAQNPAQNAQYGRNNCDLNRTCL